MASMVATINSLAGGVGVALLVAELTNRSAPTCSPSALARLLQQPS
jgi:hypothetical protein